MDYSKRQAALQQLNSRLQSSESIGLGITGSKIHFLNTSSRGPVLKSSRIPRPASPSMPLPPPGYVSESITALTYGAVPPMHSPAPPTQSATSNPAPPTQSRTPKHAPPTQSTTPKPALPTQSTTPKPAPPTQSMTPKLAPPTQSTPPKPAPPTQSKNPTPVVGRAGKHHTHKEKPRKQLRVVLHGVTDQMGKPLNKSLQLKGHSDQSINKRRAEKRHTTRRDVLNKNGRPVLRVVKARKVTRGSQSSKSKDISRHSKGLERARLNKLRMRCVARKFSVLWMKRVFGRVHPVRARCHYSLLLMKRMFSVWYGEMWLSRREWKLMIRAECHDRYRLWQSVWSVWTAYTSCCRERKMMRQTADQLSFRHLKRKMWNGWQEYVRVRMEKKAVQRRADQWRRSQLLLSVWCCWQQVIESRRQGEARSTLALYHWAHRLTHSVWHSWLEHLRAKQVTRLQEGVAWHLHSRALLSSSWVAWRQYICHRQHKLELIGLAMASHSDHLLNKTFVCWRMRFLRQQEIAQFQELIDDKGRIARRRRSFQQWEFYVALRQHKDYQLELAVTFHGLSVKMKGLVSLRRYLEQQRRENGSKLEAQRHRTMQLLHQCWLKWLCGCEHREEMKMGPQSRIAQNHFSRRATRKALAGWIQYTNHCRLRKLLNARADHHFRITALPRCFSALQTNVEIQSYKYSLQVTGTSFRRETLLSMVFYKWWRRAQYQQDVRMLERVAILHDEQIKKRRLLRLWRERTRDRVRQLAQEATAEGHHRLRIIATGFDKWRSRINEAILRQQRMLQAISYHDDRLVNVSWGAWRKYIGWRRISKENMLLGMKHHGKVVSHLILQSWKAYHCRQKVKKAKVLSANKFYSTSLKRRGMMCWSIGAEVCKTRRQLVTLAWDHYQATVLTKYYSLWQVKTAASIEARQIEDDKALRSRFILMSAKHSRILSQWSEFTNRCIIVRLAEETAGKYHHKRLQQKTFNSWWEYRKRRLRKELLTRQCVWFQRTRLISSCYSKWRFQFMDELIVNQKSTLSLWHWSQTLHKKVLIVWHLYLLDKKRKRERYSIAMDRHRTRLVKIGVTRWIAVATLIQAQREETALHIQAEGRQSVLQCAQRCAAHWRILTRQRRGTHLPPHTFTTHVPLDHHLKDPHMSQATPTWNTMLKDLNLPDSQLRPQPRRLPSSATPLFSPTWPRPLSDVLPRETIRPSSHKPMARVPRPQLPLSNGSFTFLSSTYSEGEATGNTHTLEMPSNPGHGHFNTSSSQVCVQHQYLGRHDQESPTNGQRAEDNGCSGTRAHQVSHTHIDGLPSCLTDASVQVEMLQMRETLKSFHLLKDRQKVLEERLSLLVNEGESDQLHQVRQELQSVMNSIQSKEPNIKKLALRIKQLVTQSGLS